MRIISPACSGCGMSFTRPYLSIVSVICSSMFCGMSNFDSSRRPPTISLVFIPADAAFQSDEWVDAVGVKVLRGGFELREATEEVSGLLVARMLGLHENLAVPLHNEGVVRPDVHSFSWDAPSTRPGWR